MSNFVKLKVSELKLSDASPKKEKIKRRPLSKKDGYIVEIVIYGYKLFKIIFI